MKQDGSACLADFGLMAIVVDSETTDITTSADGGTKGSYRWMAPELFYPNDFGMSKFQLTKESDCYAFGMLIYEVGSLQMARASLCVQLIWFRFSQGRPLSKKLKFRGRYLPRSSRESARVSQEVFLRG